MPGQKWAPPSQVGKRSKEAAVIEIRAALVDSGDTHIVDDAEDFELVEVLGRGSFGQAELRRVSGSDGSSDGSFIVVKRVPLQSMSAWYVKALISEVTNGALMRHPNIVRLYGAYISEQSELCMALQYGAGGTLWDTIGFQKTAKRGAFPTEFVTAWLGQLCDAVQYMHDRRVLHRDLSSTNIFLSFYGEILLGDLGLSRQLKNDAGLTQVSTQVGTPPYMSPELVAGQEYGTGSDVWAVGIVLFEMLALCRPYDGSNSLQVYRLIEKGEPREQARTALELSGHPLELRQLASSSGLLNPQQGERTRLTRVLELFPLEAATDDADKEAAEAAEAITSNLLKGPLRPHSLGSFRRRKKPVDDDASSSSSSSHLPASSASDTSSFLGPHQGRGSGGRGSGGGGSRESSSHGAMGDPTQSIAGSYSSVSYSITSESRVSSASRWSELTSLTSASSAERMRTARMRSLVPQDCPALPVAFLPRQDLLDRLLPRVQADTATVGFEGASVAFGMGGTGKSILAASLMRHPSVCESYDRLCWLTLGQTPDFRRLLAMLRGQLLHEAPKDGEYGDLLVLQQSVARAATGLSVFCVFDDVWDPAHARVVGESLEGAVLLFTTRVHRLLPGAHHVHCGLLSNEESLQLLLRAGDVSLPSNKPVPKAATEAVSLCGRLPITLALAGAMIQEHADRWEQKLVPLLRGEHRKVLLRRSINDADESDDEDDDAPGGADNTVEGRVITSSLSLLRSKRYHTSVVLFMMCAVFPEDATVAAAIFDTLEGVFGGLVSEDRVKRKRQEAKRKEAVEGKAAVAQPPVEEPQSHAPLMPRRCLKVLLDHSLLQGSIRDGILMHDLLRAFAIARISPTHLEALNGDVLVAICAALEVKSPDPDILVYARAHLEHHAAGACATCSEGTPLDGNTHKALQLAIHHPLDWVRLSITLGLGLNRVCAAAQAAAAAGHLLVAGQLWVAACGLPDKEGECRWEAWCALRRISPVTAVSVEIEAQVIRGLVLKKGMKINSPEHEQVNARLEELIATEPGKTSHVLRAARDSSLSMFYFASLCVASGSQDSDGFLHNYRQLFEVGGVRTAEKLGATHDAARACAALQQVSSHNTLLHAEKGYTWEVEYGERGCWLKDLVDWYAYKEHHAGFKNSNGRDTLLSGLGSALMLLRWGEHYDDDSSKWHACTERWATIATDVHLGKVKWRQHRIDLVDMRATRAVALAAGRFDEARRLFLSSPEGAFFTSIVLPTASSDSSGSDTPADGAEERRRTVAQELSQHVQSLNQYFAHWQMPCTWSLASFELLARAVGTYLTLIGEKSEERSLRSDLARVAPFWLPSPAALLSLATSERAWDVFMTGAQHPSLACAMVSFKLGRSNEAKEVAAGLLRTLKQPVSRFEAQRLLARCAAATGSSTEAVREHLRAAAAEAAAAGYTRLEKMAKRELDELGGGSPERRATTPPRGVGPGSGSGGSGGKAPADKSGKAKEGRGGPSGPPPDVSPAPSPPTEGSSSEEPKGDPPPKKPEGSSSSSASKPPEKLDPGAFVREAQRERRKSRSVTFQPFATEVLDVTWKSGVDPSRLFPKSSDDVSASGAPEARVPLQGSELFKRRKASKLDGSSPPSPAVKDDSGVDSAKVEREDLKPSERFARTTRKVSSLKLPLLG